MESLGQPWRLQTLLRGFDSEFVRAAKSILDLSSITCAKVHHLREIEPSLHSSLCLGFTVYLAKGEAMWFFFYSLFTQLYGLNLGTHILHNEEKSAQNLHKRYFNTISLYPWIDACHRPKYVEKLCGEKSL